MVSKIFFIPLRSIRIVWVPDSPWVKMIMAMASLD